MLTILNDVHIGAERSAGTTKATRLQLRDRLLSKLEDLLPQYGDLMILGDLFDGFNAPSRDVAKVFIMLSQWLDFNTSAKLYLVAGNHDLSKSSEVYGSFDLLAELLQADYSNIVVIKQPTMTPHGYVIPHLPNQDAFNEALEAVPECNYLFLHCNYDNFFATKSDQSLNISKEQVDACKAKCVVLGHEHQQKMLKGVVIPGNQIASSVSDWLGAESKSFVRIHSNKLELVEVAKAADELSEVDWKQLETVSTPFVRVTGTASVEEAPQVVTAIAKYRERSDNLVITNAVQIASTDSVELDANTLEGVRAYSVWTALEKVFSEEDMTILKDVYAA